MTPFCQLIQLVRSPVSPSGIALMRLPKVWATVEKTSSSSFNGTLPTSRIGVGAASLILEPSLAFGRTQQACRPDMPCKVSTTLEPRRVVRNIVRADSSYPDFGRATADDRQAVCGGFASRSRKEDQADRTR